MQPGKYDIKIYRGSTFGISLTASDDNGPIAFLQTYTSARMQIRPSWDISKPGHTVRTPLLELTTANGRLRFEQVGLEAPYVESLTIELSAAETAALKWNSGVYELELVIDSGTPEAVPIVDKFLYGTVNVTGEVTV